MKLKINSLILGCVISCSGLLAQESSLEAPAKRWINENSRSLGIQSFSQLQLNFVKKGNAGETLRFQQMIKNVPVFQSEIVVHFNKEGKITYTSSESLKKQIKDININPSFTNSEALKKAHVASNTKGEITFEENKLFVYLTEAGDTKLVYRVLTSSHDHPGSWETIVDAQNGNVLSVKDIANYHHDKNENPKPSKKNQKKEISAKKVLVSGSGYIFNPDPLSKMQMAYGGQYVDNNDATNPSLDAARSLVTIPELDFTAGVYKLKGSYAEIKDLETPSTGLFTQATNQFLFNRNDQGFEAVNAYWHIDNSLRYINETLNIVCKPLTNEGILWYDPHGLDGDDNSYYNNGRLVFGEGGVDDAEDADVVLHELGHGLHDWLTNGSLSQVQGLSEGCGDYWAQSYSRSLGQWPSSTPAYNWMFSWDGHNEYWSGRITNYSVLYPGSGAIHTRGQIWASALMRIYDKIGRAKTDRAFLEGLTMTDSSTNQQNAAIAVRQAAIDMLGQFGFACGDITTMTQEFTAAGYVLPAYNCVLSVDDVAKKEVIAIYPNPVSDILNISMKINKEEKVEIYNMEGRKVLETTINNGKNTINVSHLQTGDYILSSKGLGLSTKFIKK
ncbi:T9SS type A sorting domain-containing protein [Chryseobacterium polytrichastri]|uniref:Por secretion system C-terminal sorting domain-containing protein n=1 Tax=Chryseobacterium polytrichastri TaxID=1302687 RepID=A0A1M7CJS1_9FLAO|nr:T9SS type A sorting domain-containing protein [Chryseobacterium polytrichastri]SHL67407.1 Por secretion system C-terminal sorting domain-containing protein [Chryseobacterium polytrichastri]